jgi:RNA methyltransferase, TrmH family
MKPPADFSALTDWHCAFDHALMEMHPKITSRQNPRVKEAVRLRSRRERARQGRFLIDGARETLRAVAADLRFQEAFVCDELCDTAESVDAVYAVQSTTAEVFRVSPAVYAKLAFGDRLDGIVAVALAPRRGLNELQLSPRPIIAALEGIEKPGNLGAILRSADAAGVDAVVVAEGRTDLYNPNTIRASLGTVFRDNICEATTTETIGWLRGRGLPILAARPDADALYTEIDMREGVAIVLGSEAVGLTDAWSGEGVVPVRLPMHGLADSLNVSTTAAVLFYEALRQRDGK